MLYLLREETSEVVACSHRIEDGLLASFDEDAKGLLCGEVSLFFGGWYKVVLVVIGGLRST